MSTQAPPPGRRYNFGMSPRPFPLRLVLVVGLTMLVVAGACGGVIHWTGRHAVYLQQVQNLDQIAALIRRELGSGADATPPQARRDELRRIAEALGVRVTLIAGDGAILFDSDASAGLMDNHNGRPEVVQARATRGRGQVARRSETIEQWSVYVARLLDPDQPAGVVVRVSQWRHPAPLRGASLLAVMGAAGVSGLGAGLVLWLLLRNQWVVPVRTLGQAVRQMAAGDWGRRAASDGSDEVRALAAALNEMAQAGQRQSAELHHQRADVRSLADTIPDAVLVTDADARVTLLNRPAAELLGVTARQAMGQGLVNVVGDEALIELVESVRRVPAAAAPGAREQDVPREVRLYRDGRHLTFHAHAEPTAGGGVLLVLRDVSTLSETVQMKADFVANASHELRTPISAIKVAFETLREVYAEDPEQAERCLRIIDGHMTRLEEMLRDLLDLSRVESAAMKPYVRELSSADVLSVVGSTMHPLARQKGVELCFEDAGPVRFAGDERLLNLVLKNLVENSVKFTPAGGRVTVGVARRDGAVEIVVTDTGVGIPPEHLDRVFERFYQVDPARSGSAGRGTGLGLAIVKHAVHAMGGTVEIRSAVGRGTAVSFTVPQHGGGDAPEAGGGSPASRPPV